MRESELDGGHLLEGEQVLVTDLHVEGAAVVLELADFRAAWAAHQDDTALTALIEGLLSQSPEFAR